jgi:type IV pilus assembly protein PilE
MRQETSMMINLQRMKNEQGITLVELLAVVAIVAILAAIAIPMYTGYLQRARRADAKTALEQMRASQEMRRAERGGYATDIVELRTTWSAPAARVGDYDISFTGTLNVNSFTAQAVPWNPRQISDGTLTINHRGVKLPADKWAR